MIGSILGAAVGAAGSIFGGVSASKAMKKAKANIKARERENEAWYNRRYNEDSTQLASAMQVLNETREAIRERNRAAAGTAAVMGTSPEAAAVEKAGNMATMADAAAKIAAAGDARKERVEATYREKQDGLEQQLAGMDVARAGAIGQAIGGAATAAMDLGATYDDIRAENLRERKEAANE